MNMHKTSIKILTSVAVVVVALGVTYAIMLARATARLRRAYADLEKDGRPMRAAEVIPPQVPDAQNGAMLYASATLLLKAQSSPETGQPDARREELLGYLSEQADEFAAGTLDPNKQAEFRQLMEQEVVTSALSAVRQGAQRPACRFDCDYGNGVGLNPYLSDLRTLGRVIGAKACLEAEAGRSEAAWDLAQTLVTMADGRRTEPIIISQLVRMALVGLSCATIQKLAATISPNSQQYESLMGTLDTLDDVQPLVQAVDGERILMGEWLFTLPKGELYKQLRQIAAESYWPEIVLRLRFRRLTFKPLFLSDHAAYLQLMRKHAHLFEQPFSADLRDNLEKEEHAVPKRYLLTHSLTPAVGRIKDVHCRMVADVRITRAGLALLRYRQTHGSLPETLDALRLTDATDPFTGKPLFYRRDDEGFILYSVGGDLKDNDGSPKQPKQQADYDIVWRFAASEP